jgi:hypothetical protein
VREDKKENTKETTSNVGGEPRRSVVLKVLQRNYFKGRTASGLKGD